MATRNLALAQASQLGSPIAMWYTAPVREAQYFVYIMANKGGVLYVGVTSNIEARVYQHKHKLIDGFTKRYNVTRLVYFEATTDVTAAIAREKQIKGWRRSKKIALVEAMNSEWRDLSEDW